MGINTEASTAVVATTAKNTSRVPTTAAARAPRPILLRRCIFSETTIASSTIIPVANTRARRVRILMEKPMPQIIASAPASETGIDRAGTMVARHEPINTKSVTTTNATVKLSETTTSLTESRINSASSDVTTICISVKRLSRSATMASTSSEISIVLELA